MSHLGAVQIFYYHYLESCSDQLRVDVQESLNLAEKPFVLQKDSQYLCGAKSRTSNMHK